MLYTRENGQPHLPPRNKDALNKWKDVAKEDQVKQWAEYVQGDRDCKVEAPFGIDEVFKKMPSRKDLTKKEDTFKIKSPKAVAFNGEVVSSKMNSILEVLQQIRRDRSNRTISMNIEKQTLTNEIKKINELQRTLSSLKTQNHNS